ncbi:MAG: Rv3235 family protein [Actinomycetota bacterium]|nr:Rv3235 family protein [Actinomycetota bacterium]
MTTRHAPLRVLPLPRTAPPVITVEEVTTTRDPYVQDALAIDFTPDDDRYFDQQRTRSSDLPDPYAVTQRLAQALVEVMAGTRPAPQLIRWTTPEVYAVLARRALVAARRNLPSARRAVIRRVLVSEPADGVVEACAVIVQQDRVRAMAMRLTGLDGRWVVTDLTIG